jgi:hypothetical protein
LRPYILCMLLAEIRTRALASLIPPPQLRLSEWIEGEIVLPEGVSALPGKVRLWPYQREIADAISDPMIERRAALRRCSAPQQRADGGREVVDCAP